MTPVPEVVRAFFAWLNSCNWKDLKNEVNSEQISVAESVDELVRQEVASLLQDYEFFVVDIRVRGHKGSRVVEVFLDGESTVSVDLLARFSRDLEGRLDEVIEGGYRLDVSSPGADRPMTDWRQLAKHKGRTLEIKSTVDGEPQRIVGEFVDLAVDTLVVRTKDGTVSVTKDNFVAATVQLPW